MAGWEEDDGEETSTLLSLPAGCILALAVLHLSLCVTTWQRESRKVVFLQFPPPFWFLYQICTSVIYSFSVLLPPFSPISLCTVPLLLLCFPAFVKLVFLQIILQMKEMRWEVVVLWNYNVLTWKLLYIRMMITLNIAPVRSLFYPYTHFRLTFCFTLHFWEIWIHFSPLSII